jgi:hypothetical protein
METTTIECFGRTLVPCLDGALAERDALLRDLAATLPVGRKRALKTGQALLRLPAAAVTRALLRNGAPITLDEAAQEIGFEDATAAEEAGFDAAAALRASSLLTEDVEGGTWRALDLWDAEERLDRLWLMGRGLGVPMACVGGEADARLRVSGVFVFSFCTLPRKETRVMYERATGAWPERDEDALRLLRAGAARARQDAAARSGPAREKNGVGSRPLQPRAPAKSAAGAKRAAATKMATRN